MQIDVKNGKMEVGTREGGHPTLVLLHFFGGAGSSWRPLLDALADEFASFAPDLRGFGASSPAPVNYSVDQAAQDVTEMLSALPTDEFVLCGHSMGGKIALRVAADRPKGLKGVVLFAPSPPTPEPMSDQTRETLRQALGDASKAEEVVRGAAGEVMSPEVFAQSLANHLRATPEVWNAWLDVGSREDVSGLMAQVEVPVLVVAGARDEGMTPELLQREVVARLANARLETVDAGHLLPITHPQECAGLLREFVRSLKE